MREDIPLTENMGLTEDDRILSPLTGWTRGHWTALADETLRAVRPHASPGHALIHLPGPTSVSGRRSDGLEGFARTFLAAGFRIAGAGGGAPVPGDLAEWYAQGIAAGVDPASPERWPSVRDVPQAKVEAASIALALHESRAVLWDALDDRVRDQTVAWLSGVIGQPYPACNWVWFRSIVEAFLRSVGGPWSADDLEATIDLTESWYVGDGWYTDGGIRNFDWYAGWAMHFYPLWYCRISGGDAGPALAERYRERLRSYLDGVCCCYAPDGPPLHQGRSLIYRYAALAPVWVGAIFDATPLAPGQTRRLASGVLRHFLDRGAWDSAGLHPVGWYDAFEPMRQPYSGAGSPYWASKGFAGLVLPDDHPVWTATEERLPLESREVALALPAPGWLISGTRADGIVRVFNHGTDHQDDQRPTADDPGYARYAFSTHAGPEYGVQAGNSPVDNHIALIDEAGAVSHRSAIVPLGVKHAPGSGSLVGMSRHRARWLVEPLAAPNVWPPAPVNLRAGPIVTTASVLRGAIEVRIARVDADASPDADADAGAVAGGGAVGAGYGSWMLRFGGFALADATPPESLIVDSLAVARRADGLTSGISGLRGLEAAAVCPERGGNAFGRCSAVPTVSTRGPVTPGEVVAAAVIITGDLAISVETIPGLLPAITVTTADGGGEMVVIRWPDGSTDQVSLPL